MFRFYRGGGFLGGLFGQMTSILVNFFFWSLYGISTQKKRGAKFSRKKTFWHTLMYLQGRNRRGAGWRFPRGPRPSAISRGPHHTVKKYFSKFIFTNTGGHTQKYLHSQSSYHFYTTRTNTQRGHRDTHTHLKIILNSKIAIFYGFYEICIKGPHHQIFLRAPNTSVT